MRSLFSFNAKQNSCGYFVKFLRFFPIAIMNSVMKHHPEAHLSIIISISATGH